MVKNIGNIKLLFIVLLQFVMVEFSSCSNVVLPPIENFVAKNTGNVGTYRSVSFSFDGKENAVKYMIYESEINNPKTSRMIIDSVSNIGLSYKYASSDGYYGKTLYYWVRYSNGKNISNYSSVQSVII